MFESTRNRWLLAIGVSAGVAVVGVVAITAFFSRATQQAGTKGNDAVAIWKARTGVDLNALPKLHPAHPDSEDARALDALLGPIDLHLGGRYPDRHEPDREPDTEDLDALRDYLRAAIRSSTTEPPALSAPIVALIERHTKMLDAVTEYLTTHRDIHWREDFGPRPRSSALYTVDHLTLHRLLIGRAFLALERRDTATAMRMLSTSQQLNLALLERQELDSQFIATGVERLQLALLRRAGAALHVTPAEPTAGIRERYLAGISAEAALVLTNVRQSAFTDGEDDLPDRIVDVLAGPHIAIAASEAVALTAAGVGEIQRSQDGCVELGKKRPEPRGMFAGNFFTLNPTEAWRRFVVLELDRAITAAVLTGQTTSPCMSVVISVRDDGKRRTVEAKGLPAESENVIALPLVVTAGRN